MDGFYWSANSPYIRGQWVRARRAPRAPAISEVVTDGFIDLLVNGRTYRNANPAYMIYEIMTNPEWGMGGPASLMGESFKTAATTLKNEGFGLFMLWVQSDAIENFLSEVLDHIQAFLYFSPRTGKWELKLLRADYDVTTLPSYDTANASFGEFARKLSGERVNEIVVTWTNPVTEKPETVGMQDLASVVQQGGQIISQTRNYYGVRSADLALQLASRDLRSASAALASVKMRAFRSAWATSPGDVVRVTIPNENVVDVAMRVQDVDYGDGTDRYVTVTLLEDIFGLDAPVYTGAPATGWQTTARQPNRPAEVKLFTAPAFVVANAASQYVSQPIEPEVNVGLLIADTNPDFLNYEAYTATTLANGDVVQQSLGARAQVGLYSTATAMAAETFTEFPGGFPELVGPAPRLASLVFIGGGGDSASEMALVQTITETGGYTLARGILDTVPRAWPAGTPLWFLNDQVVLDTVARAPGEVATYRPLMRTSLGLLAYDLGEDRSITLSARPYLPLRPADVQVNGVGFGTVALAGSSAVVTWANRNRLLETSQVLNWRAPSVTPESGQTTTIEVLDSSGAVIHSYTGLTGTTHTIATTDLVGAAAIRIYSMRGSYQSLQSYMLMVTV